MQHTAAGAVVTLCGALLMLLLLASETRDFLNIHHTKKASARDPLKAKQLTPGASAARRGQQARAGRAADGLRHRLPRRPLRGAHDGVGRLGWHSGARLAGQPHQGELWRPPLSLGSTSDATEQMRLDQHGSPIAAYVSPSNHNDLLSLFGNAAQARARRSTPGPSADFWRCCSSSYWEASCSSRRPRQ